MAENLAESYPATTSQPSATAHQEPNHALRFRGDDYVTMGTMDLSGHSVTIQAWVKPTRFPNTLHTIAGMERSGEAAALLRVGDVGLAASKPQFVVQIGDGQAKLSAESRLETGEWQHVAATYDGSHMRLYIDGELDAIRDQDGRMSANGVFRVARSFGGRYFYGTIDEVEVWRAALSQDRIQEGISERLDQRGGRIMGYWPFDEGEGGVVNDQSDNRQDGTIEGATWTQPGAPLGEGRQTTSSESDPRPDQVEVDGFHLKFSESFLTYEPNGAGPQVAVEKFVVDYGKEWEVIQMKDFLYQLRKPHWNDMFWEVNTSRREVYRVENGTFGEYGGQETTLDIVVDPTGSPENPERFQLRFPEADLWHVIGESGPELTVSGTGDYRTVIDEGGEWEVSRLKNFLFHVRQRDWNDFFWKVNTSRGEVYQVKNGTFGGYGGTEETLGVEVSRVVQ